MIRLTTLLLLSLVHISALAQAPDGYHFIPFDKALKQAGEEARLMFVYFGRPDCGYCEKTNKETFIDDDVHERYSENYVLSYVNVVTEQELGKHYRVSATPVFLFMTPKGKIIHRKNGAQTIEELLRTDTKIQNALTRADST